MSYPLQIREHPIPGRRYATVGRGAFEDKIAKMRMREENYYKVWNNVVNYYDAMDVKTKSHGKWASNDFFVRSYENYCERERARQAQANLELRRSKLKEKLQHEDELYRMELARLPAHRRSLSCCSDSAEYRRRQQRVEAMRAELEEAQRRQERERLEQARQRLQQHWRVNNAVIRQMESERLSAGARQMWEQQLREKEHREQQEREQEQAAEQERRELWEREERRLRQEEDTRQRSLQQAREALDKQLEEVRQREKAEAELRAEENDLLERQRQIEEAIARREEAERRRQSRQIGLFQAQQCNAKLRQRSAQVEETLKEEQDFLNTLMASGDRDRQKLAEAAERAESKQLHQVLQKQLELERQRQQQMELLFSEEAERLWRRREADWAREEAARRQLMADVVSSWRQQAQLRLQRCRADRQREEELREAAARQAEEQRRFVQEAEELRRKRQEELRDSWARQIEDRTRRRDAELREEEAELRRQREADQQEVERLQQELSRMQFNASKFNQYRDHRQTRRPAW